MDVDRVLLHMVDETGRRVKRAVDPAEVYFLEAEGGATLVRTYRAERLRDTRALGDVAELFAPFGFQRIHRSYAVNLHRILDLRPRDVGDDWEVRLEPPVNRVLPVSRAELAELEESFGDR